MTPSPGTVSSVISTPTQSTPGTPVISAAADVTVSSTSESIALSFLAASFDRDRKLQFSNWGKLHSRQYLPYCQTKGVFIVLYDIL